MAVLTYPSLLLKFTALSWQIVNSSRSGGAGILGTEQVIVGPGSVWRCTATLNVTSDAWNGSDDLLTFKGFLARMRGRSGIGAMPYFDGRGPGQLAGMAEYVTHSDGTIFSDGTRYRQGTLPVTLSGAAGLNTTTLTLTYPAGFNPRAGQCITMPDGWMHQISHVDARDGNDWTVSVLPWTRAAYSAGADVEVDRPTCPMRLASDESGLLTRQVGQVWANPTLEFIEAF